MALELYGLHFPGYDLDTAGGAGSMLLQMLAMGLVVHAAAHIVTRKSTLPQGFASAAVGIVAAQLAYALTQAYWIVGLLLGLVAFCLVVAAMYRKGVREAALIGAMAWVLWILVNLGIGYVQAHWH